MPKKTAPKTASKSSTRITVAVPHAVYFALQSRAAKEGVTYGEVARRLLIGGLEIPPGEAEMGQGGRPKKTSRKNRKIIGQVVDSRKLSR